MKSISKEEFEEIGGKYPLAYDHFRTWIDSYKASVNWHHLFNSDCYDNWNGLTTAPKFHELPFEIQFGILAKFMIEIFHDDHILLQLDIHQIKKRMSQALYHLQKKLEALEMKQELDIKKHV